MNRALLAPLMSFALCGCIASMVPAEGRMTMQNRYDEVRSVLEPKIAKKGEASTGDLFYLCTAYSKTRAYDRLFPCLDQFQGRIDSGAKNWGGFDWSAVPLLLRAQAHIELGDPDRAIAEAEAGYALAESARKYMRIMARGVLSLAYARAGRRSDAERVVAELAAIGTGYPDTILGSEKYVALARTRMALGDWNGALKAIESDNPAGLLKGFVDVVTGAPLSGGSIFAFVDLPKRFMRARALMELGQRAAAREAYDALLAMPAISQNADLLWIILDDRGRIAEADGDTAAAERFYQRAVDAVELQRASISAEAGRIGFVGDKQGLYLRLVHVLLARGAVADAFTTAEQAKSRALVDLLGTRKIATTKSASVAKLVSRLQDAQQSLLEIDTSPTAGMTRSASVETLAAELRTMAPEVASLVTVSSPSLSQVQSLLAEDETLVEYYGGGDYLIAFVIGRTSAAARRLEGKGLSEDVTTFRRELQKANRNSQPSARRLYARLVGSLSDLIRGDRLLIVPHGPLHYLPFAALHDSNDYLIARYSMRMLPSAGVLPFVASPRAIDDRILLFGNPDVGNPEMDLPGAHQEVEAIQRLWPNSTVLVRAQASKAALKRLATNYHRLHFATHGTFRPQAPMASGLLLAPGGGSDSLLSVGELYDLSLNADLVTLSACETGLGAIQNGDDVVGLQRGFLFAGARTIVSTLWKVSDEATRDLMVHFYDGLAKGLTKQEALRNAQLAVRAEMPEPFFWAAFQLTGGQ